MGAGSSRVEAPPGRRKRLALAGCFCGGSSSAAAASAGDVGSLVAAASSSGANEVESRRSEQIVIPAEFQASVATKDIQISGEPEQRAHPSSSTISHHLRFNNFSCHESKEDMLGTENAETSGLGRSSVKDVTPMRTFNCEVTNAERVPSERIGSIEPELVEPSSGNVDTNMACITEVGPSLMTPERIMPHFEFGETGLHGTSFRTVLSSERSDTSQSSLTSEFAATSTTSSIIGESMPDVIPSAADIPILTGPQGQSGGSILNDDMASIFSSDVLGHSRETNNSEMRRNNRRVMWDAFSRRGSRGYVEFDTDDLGFYSRWLELGDDLFGDEVEETRYFHRRRHGSIRLSQYSRSRIREHRRAVFDNGNEQSTIACPLGIHQAGRCTCDSLLVAEESSAQASISRIVMLTEALFEVLDEIHRQPASLALSMVSVQAPESIVDSLPCKNYKKLDTAQCSDDMEQCHICLTEYEDGDEIRILPCKHEFHLQCVDKWLKEVHRVCPLCRGDVCEGAS